MSESGRMEQVKSANNVSNLTCNNYNFHLKVEKKSIKTDESKMVTSKQDEAGLKEDKLWIEDDIWHKMPAILIDFIEPEKVIVDYTLAIEYLF